MSHSERDRLDWERRISVGFIANTERLVFSFCWGHHQISENILVLHTYTMAVIFIVWILIMKSIRHPNLGYWILKPLCSFSSVTTQHKYNSVSFGVNVIGVNSVVLNLKRNSESFRKLRSDYSQQGGKMISSLLL